MAPETMTLTGYGLSVDYFSLGVMIFELLHGTRPWKAIDANMAMLAIDGEVDPLAAVKRTSDPSATPPHKEEEEDEGSEVDEIRFSSRLSPEAKSLLIGLLEFKPHHRLGSKRGWEEVKAHPFFHAIDWQAMQAKAIKPPFQPDLTHANCTPDADLADQLLDKTPKKIKDEEQKVFDGWSWNTKISHEDTGGVAGVKEVEGVAVGSGGVVAVVGAVEVKEVKVDDVQKTEEVKAAPAPTPTPSNPPLVTSVSAREELTSAGPSVTRKEVVEEVKEAVEEGGD